MIFVANLKFIFIFNNYDSQNEVFVLKYTGVMGNEMNNVVKLM